LSGGGSYSLSGTTYTVTGLTANTAYTFTVTATTATNSTNASATTIQTYIAAPTNVVATATSRTTASVTFTAPAGGSVNAISYTLSGGGSYSLSGTTFTVTGLTANTAYTFTVNAISSANNTSTAATVVTTYISEPIAYGPTSLSSMILTNNRSIYGCGSNGNGQLGDGTTTDRSTFTLMTNNTGKTPLSISCGDNYTMVLMSDGSVYGCGLNTYGQLGNGTTTQQTSLTLMTNTTGKTPTAISCGQSHTIVLMSDGSVYGCGYNGNGRLGDSTTTNRTTLRQMTNTTGKTPASVYCGYNHTIVLMSDGSIYGFGLNSYGQL
jgi:hypothetical protein